MTHKWTVKLQGRKQGAIGLHGTEKRTYEMIAETQEMASDGARRLAYEDGLEHVTIISAK